MGDIKEIDFSKIQFNQKQTNVGDISVSCTNSPEKTIDNIDWWNPKISVNGNLIDVLTVGKYLQFVTINSYLNLII